MHAPNEDNAGWRRVLVLGAVGGGWLAAQILLMRYTALALPRALASQLSLELYLILVQLVALALGLALAKALLKQEARRELGLVHCGGRAALLGVLLAPGLFVLTSYVAVYLALPTLLDEIRRGGAELVRQNAGQVGRAMRQSPLAVALLWSVLVSPVAEELLFRGALWRAFQSLSGRLFPPKTDAPASLPGEFIEKSLLVSALARVRCWLTRGGVATLLTTALFGAMHFDMPGGQGIIRVTAATGLGLVCGVARQASGGVLVPVAIHVLFNLLGLAGARRWLVSETFPTYYMVPTLTSLLGALGVAAAVTIALVEWFSARRGSSVRM